MALDRALLAKDAVIFFTTIAVLLGTGILGLPIKLVYSGLLPFLAIFTVTLFMQLAIVWVHADTLQRAQKHMQARIALEKGEATADAVTAPQVDLHTMGRLYLSPAASVVFDAAVLLTFVSTLISYSLAGANAFSQLLSVPVDSLITPFVGACTFLIVFASGVIQPVVSVLTFCKVVLLTFIIAVCGVVAGRVDVPYHSSWSDVMNPFLVGTVAIGGIADMMPVFFTSRAPSKRDVDHFRWSIASGIVVCYVLNVVWARAVLGIVPQTEADAAADGSSVSLEGAGRAGDIATKPVILVIDGSYPAYHWVASTVTAFITLSISVSFNAVGLGIKHVLDGMAVSVMRGLAASLGLGAAELAAMEEMSGGDPHAAAAAPDSNIGGEGGKPGGVLAACSPARLASAVSALCASRSLRLLLTARGVLYALTFGTILGVALADPSGFISVLEIFTSMALNMAGGVFVVALYLGVRRPPAGSLHRAGVPLAALGQKGKAAGAAASSSGGRVGGGKGGGGITQALMAADHLLSSYESSSAAAGADPRDSEERQSLLHGGGAPARDGDARSPLRVAVTAVDPGIADPIHEALGAALALFCLATFSVAVVYDMYNAGVSQGVYGPHVAAWIAAAGGACLWRFFGMPAAAFAVDALRGPEAWKLGDHEEYVPAGALGVYGHPSVTGAVCDVALCTATAWSAWMGGGLEGGPSLVTAVALGVHALRVGPGLGLYLGLPVAGAVVGDVLHAAGGVALAVACGVRGHVGPAALAATVALAAGGLAASRRL